MVRSDDSAPCPASGRNPVKAWFFLRAVRSGTVRWQPTIIGARMGEGNMKLKLFGTALAALTMLAAAVSAQAADIPRPIYKGIRPVIAYYNWTGFYLGINGGYGWGTSTWDLLPATTIKPNGGLVGGTLGYNYQVGSWVLGIEGDIDWSGVKGDVSCVAAVTCTTENPWLGTIRGRVGYAFDRWLPYITGGGAYGNIKASASVPIAGAALSASKSNFGWTVGAGLEYAFLGNWSAKIEYLYVDLGSVDDGVPPVVNTVTFKENIVRAGLNYKFSGPIFSRY
jgi:outer membrane immunogenic protein